MDPIDPLNGSARRLDPLDAALVRVLPAPALPDGFTARLHAAVARDVAAPRQRRRESIEQEWLAVTRQLDAVGHRLGLLAIGWVSGAGVATGLAIVALLPWIRATFGMAGISMLPLAGAAVGIAIGLSAGLGLVRIDD